MIPREKVFVGMPSFDRRVDIGCVSGLMQCAPYYERPFFMVGMSNICLARNIIAHLFVEKWLTYDWLMFIDSDIAFTPEDWNLLWEGDEDIVTAEYAKKVIGEKPAQFGLGFTRIHRTVFEKIKDMKNDEGGEYAQRFYHQGEMMINYFPNGANPAGRWIGEDHGFFLLASLTECKPRIETRTCLKHVGQFEFGYPDQIPGFSIIEPDLDPTTKIELNK